MGIRWGGNAPQHGRIGVADMAANMKALATLPFDALCERPGCGHDVLDHSPTWGCVAVESLGGPDGTPCECDGYIGSDPRGSDTEA